MGKTFAARQGEPKRFGSREAAEARSDPAGESKAATGQPAQAKAGAEAPKAAAASPAQSGAKAATAQPRGAGTEEARPAPVSFERPSGQVQVVPGGKAGATEAVPVRIDLEATVDTGPDPKDAEMAARVLKASHQLQQAMDQAALSGIIIEPTFQRCTDRFAEFGSNVETYLCQVQMYRKLV
jgi:hypothetical protein